MAIVQARVGSARLPGKVLAQLGSTTVLGQVLRRLAAAESLDAIVVATTERPEDDAVEAIAREAGVSTFRGSADDVLDRYHRAARELGAKTVVRVTGDCPFLDPAIVDDVVRRFAESGCDYASNTLRETYPDGLDVEVFSAAALERAWATATSAHEREHVTPFLKVDAATTRLSVESELPEWAARVRLTVDDPEDLELARAIDSRLAPEAPYGIDEVMALLDAEPELMTLNNRQVRNEGYYRSLAEQPRKDPPPRTVERSLELKERAATLIPSGSQTFSKGPSQFVQGVSPVYLQRGRGSRVWDVDGNEYVDYSMALGAVILGHADERVNDAVRRQLEQGTVHSLPHPLELELAERLVEIIPCAEMVRYGKNGSDATTGAIRAARAFTGRERVATTGYHGWHDWYIGSTTRRAGVPAAVAELTTTFEYNNLESLERILSGYRGEVAAVILEPMGVVEPNDGFLEGVVELAHDAGALVVFDEIITGFRLARAGGQERFGVVPDLGCFGKGLGNGFPISVVAGRADVMAVFDEVFFSFTFGGETLSLAASLATLDVFDERDVTGEIADRGARIRDGFNTLAAVFGIADRTRCVGHPARTVIDFSDGDGTPSLELKSLFQQEVIKRDILCGGYHNPSLAHSDADVESTLAAYRDALEIMAEAIAEDTVAARLEGSVVEPVFRAF